MHSLFPRIKVFHDELINTNIVDKIYVEQCGTPEGLPLLILHNGPGSIGTDFYRRLFDPEKYRIIIMDQRGSGRSHPLGSLDNNNTNELINDIVAIRKNLNIDKWLIFGYGFGATLSLLYAEEHPQDLLGMILVGTNLCRLEDLNWIYQDGVNRIYPDHWEEFTNPLKAQELTDTIHGYHNLLNCEDDLAKMSAAKSWQSWHANCNALHNHKSSDDQNDHHKYSKALIQNYYLLNRFFIQENQILLNSNKIQEIISYIIHGRYDILSPLKGSWLLHQSLSNSKLFIIREACHDITEPSMIDALVVLGNTIYSELI